MDGADKRNRGLQYSIARDRPDYVTVTVPIGSCLKVARGSSSNFYGTIHMKNVVVNIVVVENGGGSANDKCRPGVSTASSVRNRQEIDRKTAIRTQGSKQNLLKSGAFWHDCVRL